MSTQFNFSKSRVYSFEINPTTTLHIEQLSDSISTLYFTTENRIIDLPQEITVKKYKVPFDKHVVFPIREKSYHLYYAYNYEIYWNDTMVLLLEVQKMWNIHDMRRNVFGRCPSTLEPSAFMLRIPASGSEENQDGDDTNIFDNSFVNKTNSIESS